MENLIFRKFFFDIIGFFLLGILSLSLIVWVIQAVNYLDFVSDIVSKFIYITHFLAFQKYFLVYYFLFFSYLYFIQF